MVEAVQNSPRHALAAQLASLSSEQLAAYDFASKASSGDSTTTVTVESASDDPSTFSERAPLRMPYVTKQQVFRVGVGHFQGAMFDYADWRVVFETLHAGKWVEAASLPVGMVKGQLMNATILPIPGGH